MNPSQLQNHFDAFYEDFFCEMCKYGEVEEVVVCDNNNDRMYLCFLLLAYAERLLGPDLQAHEANWVRNAL
jgi:hypothetical protein